MPQPIAARLGPLQQRLGKALFARVAGPEGPANRARFNTPGPRWFAPDRPIRQVHGDAAMFVGGLCALLLQSLHPRAMIAVAQHSDYRTDPWGRLQRTSTFLAATTFGAADDAQRAVDRVRLVHRHITGIDHDGRPYRADDPHLLRWVHVAETDSFLRTHQRYGERPLDAAGRDGYVADTAVIALALGVPDPPRTTAELAAALDAYRPELRATPEALEAARFLVRNPPLPLLARGPYALLTATAIAELPAWARRELRLPRHYLAEPVLVPPAGRAIVSAVRWAMGARRLERARRTCHLRQQVKCGREVVDGMHARGQLCAGPARPGRRDQHRSRARGDGDPQLRDAGRRGRVRPQHHRAGAGPGRRGRKRCHGHPGTKHPAPHPARGEACGQRLQGQAVQLLSGAGKQHRRRTSRRPGPGQGDRHFPRQQALDLHPLAGARVPKADVAQDRADQAGPGGGHVLADGFAQNPVKLLVVQGERGSSQPSRLRRGRRGRRLGSVRRQLRKPVGLSRRPGEPRGLRGRHAVRDQAGHQLKALHVAAGVTAVAALLAPFGSQAVAAIPGPDRGHRHAEPAGGLPGAQPGVDCHGRTAPAS
jgi:uncharacterized protein (DUF2236 family)